MKTKENELLIPGIPHHRLKDFLREGRPVRATAFTPPLDDLASAGLGREGLASPQPPAFDNVEQPTPEELRRRAIYENYRALADMTESGGYGKFYGPGAGYGLTEKPPELIGGVEVQGIISDSATVVVQIPDNFVPEKPTLVLIPASSSRGVYGGILAAEWALQRGYVTVLTDKGGGTGFHYLKEDKVISHLGEVIDGSDLSTPSIFRAPDPAERIASFNDRHPHRVAAKHAHSTLNVEAKWPEYVLESARFAREVLAALWPERFDLAGCRVIASGYSNGAASSLRAAEIDSEGLIHAVAVAEPNITPIFDDRFSIRQGHAPSLAQHSKPLMEYSSVLNLFQAVANLALEGQILGSAQPEASLRRLKGLQNKGLWPGLSSAEAALAARAFLLEKGLMPEHEYLAGSHALTGVYEAMSVCLANCHGRFMVTDHLFGYSYSAVDEKTQEPRSLQPAELHRLYALSTGLVPTAGVAVVNDNSLGGPVQSVHSISPSTGLADLNLDGAISLYQAATGLDPVNLQPSTGLSDEQGQRIRAGLDECRASGRLGGRPAMIVNGRCDSIIAPNHASRSYLGRHLCETGALASLSYLEVQHAHHLDTLNAFPVMAARYVPLTPYLFRALSEVDRHLTEGTPLPPSQVVRSIPREVVEGQAAALEERHLGSFQASPGPDAIKMVGSELTIPD